MHVALPAPVVSNDVFTPSQALYPIAAEAGSNLLSDMYYEWDRFVDYQDSLEQQQLP